MLDIKSNNLDVAVMPERAYATTCLPCLKVALSHQQFYLSYFAAIRFLASSRQFAVLSSDRGFTFFEEANQFFRALI
jgi:hypothetical protein